jgi:hypothetical protein
MAKVRFHIRSLLILTVIVGLALAVGILTLQNQRLRAELMRHEALRAQLRDQVRYLADINAAQQAFSQQSAAKSADAKPESAK